jgi:hypothetical protein
MTRAARGVIHLHPPLRALISVNAAQQQERRRQIQDSHRAYGQQSGARSLISPFVLFSPTRNRAIPPAKAPAAISAACHNSIVFVPPFLERALVGATARRLNQKRE